MQSVVIWGACNEDECFVTGNANATGREMAAATKKWDTTRPLSANQYRLPPPSSDPSLHTNDTLNFLSKYLDVEGFSHGGIATPGAGAVHAAYPGKNYISSECCSCQTQRGEDAFNPTTGLSYPHSLEQATCMQHCMRKTYSKYSSAAGSVVGIISGTSGVWTLFDYGGEVRPPTHPAPITTSVPSHKLHHRVLAIRSRSLSYYCINVAARSMAAGVVVIRSV